MVLRLCGSVRLQESLASHQQRQRVQSEQQIRFQSLSDSHAHHCDVHASSVRYNKYSLNSPQYNTILIRFRRYTNYLRTNLTVNL